MATGGEGVTRLRSERGTLLTEAANAITRLQKEYVGKGPTQTHAHFAGPDIIVILLEGGFTRAEESLLAGGEGPTVDSGRTRIQHLIQRESVAAIERIFERTVDSFMSANDSQSGYQVEVFVLGGAEQRTAQDLSDAATRAQDSAREIRDEHRALRAEQVASREALNRTRREGRQAGSTRPPRP